MVIDGKERSKRLELLALSCACALSCLPQARAQSKAAMSQGEAAIAVRSDVKLGIKGTGGTTSERLAKLGQAVGDQMGDIRACYRKQIAGSPELIGALRLRIALDKGDKPQVELTEQSAGSKELTACVSRALEKGHYHDVGRPAAAVLSLEFDNSRARGQAEMVERKAQLGRADARDTSNGNLGSWSSDGGELKFSVQTEQAAPAGALDLVIRGFQGGYAAFLDCRRKCEKGGASPEGDIEAELSVDRQARATTHLGKISVAHERAPACAERAFKRVKFDKPQAPVQAHVTVHFSP
jgi:hypothetical protein